LRQVIQNIPDSRLLAIFIIKLYLSNSTK
jgi:hypothetical protein